ncbi:helix-turn-helix transcriptional regulator [Nocardia sp. NPDC047648]|uniref:helix-turn-helix domain-containing protein n=1 Tax=Nocardia sp. NPDC047648 TaxID=3155625 RepID=UPI003409EE32
MGRVIYAYRTHPYHGTPLPQEHVAGWLNISQGTLSKLEKGPVPERLGQLTRFATALKIPPELLWFKLPGRSSLDDVDRHSFLRAAAAVTATAAISPTGLMRILDDLRVSETPSKVGLVEIRQLEAAADLFSTWDATYGSGVVRDVVGAQVRTAFTYLGAECAPKNRPDLLLAVGALTHTAAFMAFDACEHADATKMFQLALTCAEEADAWHLRAKVLSSMGRQKIWTGQIEQGLADIDRAFQHSDRLTSTERAMLFTARARGHAKRGRIQDTLTAVGHADENFANSEPQNDPSWMAYYDSAQHAGDTGHALFDLAVHGKFAGEARSRLAAAVAGHGDEAIRSRTMSTIKLASLVMATGDREEAVAIGATAMKRASAIKSRRAAEDIQELRDFSRRAGAVIA